MPVKIIVYQDYYCRISQIVGLALYTLRNLHLTVAREDIWNLIKFIYNFVMHNGAWYFDY